MLSDWVAGYTYTLCFPDGHYWSKNPQTNLEAMEIFQKVVPDCEVRYKEFCQYNIQYC